MEHTTPGVYFDKSCSAASEGWQASLWTSEEEQFYHYAVMAKFINWNGCSVLDVGCGQGDLLKYIKERSKAVTYTGVDASQEMIKTAKIRFPDEEFVHADFLADSFQPKQHDFVFGIGTFCLKTDNQLEYLKKSIEKLYKISRRCLGINLSSVKSDPAVKYDVYHYYEPKDVLQIALEISPLVTLNHAPIGIDPRLIEMAVFLHKE